jgi:hypothetical protein
METLGEVTTGSRSDPIFTDFPYTSVFNRVHAERFGTATVPDGQRATDDELIYREFQTDGAPLFRSGEGGQRVHRVRESAVCPTSHDKVYANGDVTFCRAA